MKIGSVEVGQPIRQSDIDRVNQSLPEHRRDAFEERFYIAHYDGKLSAERAPLLAWKEAQ